MSNEVYIDPVLGKPREKDSGGASYGPDVSRYSGHYIGEIIEWPAATPPAGCLLCDGSAVSRAEYSDLFAVIGTAFGSGDGETTFNLPDLRGRFVEGVPAGGAVGTEIEAGLPNIAGTLSTSNTRGWTYAGLGTGSGIGAITATNTGDPAAASGATGSVLNGFSFNASLSNSIYGASDTVQPPALTMLFVIVAE